MPCKIMELLEKEKPSRLFTYTPHAYIVQTNEREYYIYLCQDEWIVDIYGTHGYHLGTTSSLNNSFNDVLENT